MSGYMADVDSGGTYRTIDGVSDGLRLSIPRLFPRRSRDMRRQHRRRGSDHGMMEDDLLPAEMSAMVRKAGVAQT